ncbi:MAG: CvpA family protein [Spirochaetia bacterium]
MVINGLDIFFIVVIVIAAIRCTYKGFIAEIMSMAAIFLSILAAVLFYQVGAHYISVYLFQSAWNPVLSFLIIFLVVYLLVKIFEKAITGLFEKLHLDNLDKAFGFLFGILEGILVCALVLIVLTVQPVFDVTSIIEGSFLAQVFIAVFPISVSQGPNT